MGFFSYTPMQKAHHDSYDELHYKPIYYFINAFSSL